MALRLTWGKVLGSVMPLSIEERHGTVGKWNDVSVRYKLRSKQFGKNTYLFSLEGFKYSEATVVSTGQLLPFGDMHIYSKKANVFEPISAFLYHENLREILKGLLRGHQRFFIMKSTAEAVKGDIIYTALPVSSADTLEKLKGIGYRRRHEDSGPTI